MLFCLNELRGRTNNTDMKVAALFLTLVAASTAAPAFYTASYSPAVSYNTVPVSYNAVPISYTAASSSYVPVAYSAASSPVYTYRYDVPATPVAYSSQTYVQPSPVFYSAPVVQAAPAAVSYSAAVQPGYVAKTKGSEHYAPLPEGLGYASHHINLQNAPGTN